MPSDSTEPPKRDIYDQWVFETFGVDPSTYPPFKPKPANNPEVNADVAAISQGMQTSRDAGPAHGIQLAQLAVLGVPLPLPIPPDALPAPLSPAVERDFGHALNRAGRRLDQIGGEVIHGDLADAAGHALLGHPFPPQVDDPGYVPPGPMPPVPGTTPLSDDQRRSMGQPETFPAGQNAAPVQEGFSPSPSHIPNTTAHPVPTPAIPSIVAASNLADMDLPRTPGLGPEASMQDLVSQKAIPGREGVVLTDPPADVTELFPDMHMLSEANGIEYAMTRRADGKLVLSSGAGNRVRVNPADEQIAHTHPDESEHHPSYKDIQNLNRQWANNPDKPRPASTIVWGSKPGQTTPYGAESMDDTPFPTRKGRPR